MGNTASSDKHSASNSPRDSPHEPKDSQAHKKFPKRRESVPALSHGRAAAVPPSASLESAQGHRGSEKSSFNAQGHAQGHARQASRGRAHTTLAAQAQSDNKDAHAAETKHIQSHEAHPVQVPQHPVPTDPNIQRSSVSQSHHDGQLSPSSYHIPNSQFSRPPRLPLPIEKEDFAPGSPIISPTDLPGPLGRDPLQEDPVSQLERKSSVLSSTTVDEDEVVDDFQAHGKATGQMVDSTCASYIRHSISLA